MWICPLLGKGEGTLLTYHLLGRRGLSKLLVNCGSQGKRVICQTLQHFSTLVASIHYVPNIRGSPCLQMGFSLEEAGLSDAGNELINLL